MPNGGCVKNPEVKPGQRYHRKNISVERLKIVGVGRNICLYNADNDVYHCTHYTDFMGYDPYYVYVPPEEW